MNSFAPTFAFEIDIEDFFDWNTVSPGYFETLSRGRIIATDTTVLVCEQWEDAEERERRTLFYEAGLFHLCRVAAYEIPGDTGERTLTDIDKMEEWPAKPLVAKARAAIKTSRERFVASGGAEVSNYKAIVAAVCRFKAREERRWNWTRLIRAMRAPRVLSQPTDPPIIHWPDFRVSLSGAPPVTVD